ncbi:MAG: SRPBCC family protein [Saprospiraceae bacterium]
MKYTLSNTIDRPLEVVMEKFKEPEGVKHWMEGLQRIEHLSGTPGQVGAKTDFYFLHKNKEMKISETILEQNLPRQIKFAYQSPMGYNEVELLFEKISDNSVRQTNNSFFDLKGFMKIMGFLMKPMFKKQSLKYMTAFKHYVEQ